MINRKEIWQILTLTVIMFGSLLIDAEAADCSAISRTNNSANAVLTSSKYNTDHNTAYTAINDVFASTCTLPLESINQTQLSPLVDSAKLGCSLSISDTNTISVDRCRIGIDGTLTATSAATTVTWGCTSCASEAADTFYYVYGLNTSTATVLNLLISTTAPNGDGYDASNNRVLGRFFNNSDSNITAVVDYDQMVKPLAKRATEVIYLYDRKAQNVNSGNCSGGTWNDRTLNVISSIDETTDTVRLSNNFFTLKAGTYEIEADSAIVDVQASRLGLWNNTDGVFSLYGKNGHAGDGATAGAADGGGFVSMNGFVTIASDKIFKIKHWCTTTASIAWAFGLRTNISGVSEQYLSVKITRYE